MLKHVSLTIAFTAMIFSVQALPLLYTFDGSITNIDGENVNIDMLYRLILNFDEPGIENGSYQNDYSLNGLPYDFSSAIFYEDSDILYPSQNLIYNYNKKAYHYDGSNEYENIVLLENKINNITTNLFKLHNTLQSSFQIDDKFSVNEISIDHTASGIVTLTSISSFNPHSIPEPETIVLLLLSMCGLWIISKQKNMLNKC